jgi:hypothetical protein
MIGLARCKKIRSSCLQFNPLFFKSERKLMETTGNQRQILMLHQERPVRAEHDVVLSAPLMTDAT